MILELLGACVLNGIVKNIKNTCSSLGDNFYYDDYCGDYDEYDDYDEFDDYVDDIGFDDCDCLDFDF